jgi:GTP cyclohydrolase II
METAVLELVAQLGIGGLLFYLLMEERKARLALQERVFEYLDKEAEETRELVKEATQPRRPDGANLQAQTRP